MIAEPETVTVPTVKRTVLSQEEILKFIPHGKAICGLDRAWYDEEESDTVYAQHLITEDDCAGHFQNERLRLLVCPAFRILEWLGQLTLFNGRCRFGFRGDIGAFQQLWLPGLETFLVPGDILVMRSRITRLELVPDGSRGKGSAEGEACWNDYQVVPKVVFDFTVFGLHDVERIIARRVVHLRHRKIERRTDMSPIGS